MMVPVQVSFRGMRPSAAVEARVREEVAKLETFYREIIHCRVVVELPHKHRRKGDLYHVRIDLTVPGAELVVKKEPSLLADLRQIDIETQSKGYEVAAAHKDVYVVIRDAFKEARRQLQDFARKQQGQTKLHELPATGRVSKLFPDQDYGFVESPEGDQIYFHKNSVLDHGFGRLKIGSRVMFVQEAGEKGPQASTVRVGR